MLTMTETARNLIRLIPEESRFADTAGLRIREASASESGLGVAPADAPAADESTVEHDGARVFLDPESADRLSDSELDVEYDVRGRAHIHARPQS